MRRGVLVTDRHHDARLPEHPSWTLVKRFIHDWKPDFIVDHGDTLDLPYLAKQNKDVVKGLEGATFRADYDLVQWELDFLQMNSDEVIWLEGNHDERVTRLIERDPKFDGMITYPEAFHLEARGMQFVRQLDQPYRMGELGFAHGWYSTKYPTTAHLDRYAGNLVFGHVHRFQTVAKVLPAFGLEIQAWAIGCLCGKAPDWKKGAPSGWQNGFAVVYIDEESGFFNLYPINIIENSFMFEGRLWKL